MAWVIGEKETRKLVDMAAALRVVEKMFHDRAAGKVGSLPRRRLKGSRKQLNVMAACHKGWDLLCLRAYAGGANTITLYDGASGEMRAILNAAYLSSLRTGAASGVAAKYLAPPESRVLGLIGPGRQATFQLEAILASTTARQVSVYGRDPKKRRKFVKEMSRAVGAEWKEASSIEEVEAESDILVVATDAAAPVTDGARLKEDVLVISMGANQPVKHELSADLIARMNFIVTDDLQAAQTDSGDLIAACDAGIIQWEDVIPLEKVIAEGSPRPQPKRILFQSNGIADEDLAVARHVWERFKRKKGKAKSVSEI